MEDQEQILQELRTIKKLLLSNQSDYCDTKEACAIIGLNNYRYLAQLYKRNLLGRYSRADGYIYKKSDCRKVAEALDTSTIVLEPINNKK